jgi:DNA-binding NarL/FixJ family response regulator
MTRILIADDHPLFRLALAQTVRDAVAGAVVGEAATLDEVRAHLAVHPDTDLVLLDLHMPGSHGLMGLAALRAAHPAVAVAMISAHDHPATVRRALAHGACAYIPKRLGLEPLRAALAAVLACETWVPPGLHEDETSPAAEDRALASRLASLTPQQFKVLERVAQGRLNKQIADELGVQERTIKAHLSVIFEKLGVRNRTQAGVLLRSLELNDPARAAPPDDDPGPAPPGTPLA